MAANLKELKVKHLKLITLAEIRQPKPKTDKLESEMDKSITK